MSSIKIVKGFPISFVVKLSANSAPVNVNDGTWNVSASLHYQTKNGLKPFDITTVPVGNNVTISIANTQTSVLNHLGTGYVLLIDAAKIDNTVFIENEIPVSVVDGL